MCASKEKILLEALKRFGDLKREKKVNEQAE